MSLASDLAAMLSGFGSAEIRAGTVTGRGLVDDEEVAGVDAVGEPLLIRRTVVSLRRADWPDVAAGDTLAIDGVSYTVTDVLVSDGGQGQGQDARVVRVVVKRVGAA